MYCWLLMAVKCVFRLETLPESTGFHDASPLVPRSHVVYTFRYAEVAYTTVSAPAYRLDMRVQARLKVANWLFAGLEHWTWRMSCI